MSDTQIDFLKLFIDKGLLALILLGLAFYLNKAMEKYKASNIYHQKLSETRIFVYQDVSRAVATQMLQIQKIIGIIAPNPLPVLESSDFDEKAESLLKAHKEYKDSYLEHSSTLMKNSIFFSSELANKIIEHQKITIQFNEVFENVKTDEEFGLSEYAKRISAMGEISDSLIHSFVSIQRTLSKEIHMNPFSQSEA